MQLPLENYSEFPQQNNSKLSNIKARILMLILPNTGSAQ
jgi:hypothetical protein